MCLHVTSTHCIQYSTIFNIPLYLMLHYIQYSTIFNTPLYSIFHSIQYSTIFDIPLAKTKLNCGGKPLLAHRMSASFSAPWSARSRKASVKPPLSVTNILDNPSPNKICGEVGAMHLHLRLHVTKCAKSKPTIAPPAEWPVDNTRILCSWPPLSLISCSRASAILGRPFFTALRKPRWAWNSCCECWGGFPSQVGKAAVSY
jgi:hypothetical protein